VSLKTLPWRLIGAVVFALLVYQFGRGTMDTEWQARWAEQGEFQAKARSAAESSARMEEQRRQTEINQVRNDAKTQNKNAVADGAGADAAGERLHAAADQLASHQCASDTGVARRGQAATGAAMVLSDLFQRADRRAGELAKAYDAARIAGQACERSYDAIKKHRPTD
jgi:hypothetical protein